MSAAMRNAITLGAVLAVVGVSYAVFLNRRGQAGERDAEAPVKVPPKLSRSAAGELIVTLSRQAQEKAGIRTEALTGSAIAPETAAYGRLQEDPSASFTVRAPLAGTLRSAAESSWPAVGGRIEDGAVIGSVEPRLAPAERITLSDRLLGARGEQQSAAAAERVARTAYERARTLNADNKNISDRALQDAEARLRSAEARLEAAVQTVRLLETSLTAGSAAGTSVPLAVRRGGEVVELFARPGESVESGQPLLRLARFDTLVARVDLPAGRSASVPVSAVRIAALGQEDRPLRGEFLALAPATDPGAQGQSFLFRIARPPATLRPGLAVTAWLPVAGSPRKGVLIPRQAVVLSGDRVWVYVQVTPEQFARREVAPDSRAEGGWFAASGFSEGDRVVTVGAQLLLSEQSKHEIVVGEEGSGH